MSKTKVVVDSLPDERFPEWLFGPEEFGSISTYANSCGRFVNLQRADRAAWKAREMDAPEPGYFTRGKIFHKMCEFYYGHPELEPVWRLPAEIDEDYKTALKLFGYIKEQIPQDFATSLKAEVGLPRTLEEKARLEELFGVPFKGVVDAVVEFDEDSAERFDRKWFQGLEVVTPGTWLIDWKTESSEEREHKYVMSHQRIAYTAAAELLLDTKIEGMLFVRVVDRKKTPNVFVTQAPSAAPWEMEMVRKDFKKAYDRIKADETDGFSCFSRWGVCRFYLKGMCSRV